MVRIHDLEWDDWNEEHVARHGVEPHEAVEVVRNDPLITKGRGGTLRVVGQADGGRYLTLFVAPRRGGLFYVVTARDAAPVERRAFLRH